MKIALFSDVHGRLRIVLRMMQCWQVQHGAALDGALLAGDLGCFPDESRFDRATRRWVERDPEEAGFPRYFMRRNAAVEAVFHGSADRGEYSAVMCPILFVAGNHEDFAYLADCRDGGRADGMPPGTFPVDCYRRIHCIENGAVVRLRGCNGAVLRIGSLWGVEDAEEGSPRTISQAAARLLEARGRGDFDLLLTHDVPSHSYPGHAGSETISRVLQACDPPLHLFGHAHPVDGRHEFVAAPVSTHSWILEDVGFGKEGNGNLRGAMGLLYWDERDIEAYRVELVEDEWLIEMRYGSWMRVWPKAQDWTAGG